MTDLQGAVACAQLGKLDSVVERRQHSAAALTEALRGLDGVVLPAPRAGSTHVYWKYALSIDPDVIPGGADALGARLKARGVFCAPRYIQKPAFQCRVFRERKTYGRSQCPYSCRERSDGTRITYDESEFPGTMQGLARILVLPWNELYTPTHIDFLASSVRESVAELQRG
jgi:dTDP-4-amino-4,6-dideoxygalactose transaminase